MRKMTRPDTWLLACIALGLLAILSPLRAVAEEGGQLRVQPVALTLGDYVWVDNDVDGFQDNEEPGLAGVTVRLTDAVGNAVNDLHGRQLSPLTTGADGLYRFTDLPAGDYRLVMTAPAGYHLSPGGVDVDDDENNQDSNCTLTDGGVIQTRLITLSADSEPSELVDGDGINGNLSADCGFYQAVSVGDYLWEDSNADGIQDADETGLSDLRVSLTGADGLSPAYDVYGERVAPIVSDAAGGYRFNHLVPGEYSIIVQVPEEGYKLSPGGSDPDNDDPTTNDAATDNNCRVVDGLYQTAVFGLFTTNGRQHNDTVDCGFYRPVAVGSRIWIDLDADGRQNPGEPGLPGARVTLLTTEGAFATDVRGNVLRPQLSDENGGYFFGNLPQGDYVIRVTPPDGYLPTASGVDPDNDDAEDNNGVVYSGGSVLSSPVTLTWGTEPDNDGDNDRSTNLTVGFGFLPKVGVHIPTASSWALVGLSLLLAAVALRRQQLF